MNTGSQRNHGRGPRNSESTCQSRSARTSLSTAPTPARSVAEKPKTIQSHWRPTTAVTNPIVRGSSSCPHPPVFHPRTTSCPTHTDQAQQFKKATPPGYFFKATLRIDTAYSPRKRLERLLGTTETGPTAASTQPREPVGGIGAGSLASVDQSSGSAVFSSTQRQQPPALMVKDEPGILLIPNHKTMDEKMAILEEKVRSTRVQSARARAVRPVYMKPAGRSQEPYLFEKEIIPTPPLHPPRRFSADRPAWCFSVVPMSETYAPSISKATIKLLQQQKRKKGPADPLEGTEPMRLLRLEDFEDSRDDLDLDAVTVPVGYVPPLGSFAQKGGPLLSTSVHSSGSDEPTDDSPIAPRLLFKTAMALDPKALVGGRNSLPTHVPSPPGAAVIAKQSVDKRDDEKKGASAAKPTTAPPPPRATTTSMVAAETKVALHTFETVLKSYHEEEEERQRLGIDSDDNKPLAEDTTMIDERDRDGDEAYMSYSHAQDEDRHPEPQAPDVASKDYHLIRLLFRMELMDNSRVKQMVRAVGEETILSRLTAVRQRFGTKRIKPEEFHAVMEHLLGQGKIGRQESDIFFDMFDTNQSGGIDENEFVAGLRMAFQDQTKTLALYLKRLVDTRTAMGTVITLMEIGLLLDAMVRLTDRQYPGCAADAQRVLDELTPSAHHSQVPLVFLRTAVLDTRVLATAIRELPLDGTLPKVPTPPPSPTPVQCFQEVASLTATAQQKRRRSSAGAGLLTPAGSTAEFPTQDPAPTPAALPKRRRSSAEEKKGNKKSVKLAPKEADVISDAIAVSDSLVPIVKNTSLSSDPRIIDVYNKRFKADPCLRPGQDAAEHPPEHYNPEWYMKDGVVWKTSELTGPMTAS